jgi:hypothetical protein
VAVGGRSETNKKRICGQQSYRILELATPSNFLVTILRSSVPADNFLDKFTSSKFGQSSTQKTTNKK